MIDFEFKADVSGVSLEYLEKTYFAIFEVLYRFNIETFFKVINEKVFYKGSLQI